MNDNHKRVMASYLDDMERKLRGLQSDIAVQPGGASSAAPDQRCDLPRETGLKLLSGISDMLTEFESMRFEYGLKAEKRSLRKHANSVIVDIWVTASELRPRTLENYGALTQTDKDALESWVEKMLKAVDALFSALQDEMS